MSIDLNSPLFSPFAIVLFHILSTGFMVEFNLNSCLPSLDFLFQLALPLMNNYRGLRIQQLL